MTLDTNQVVDRNPFEHSGESQMKDFLGQQIEVGDSIVYPNRQSSSLWMNFATVAELLDNSIRVRRDDGKYKTLIRVERVTVVSKQISDHMVMIGS